MLNRRFSSLLLATVLGVVGISFGVSTVQAAEDPTILDRGHVDVFHVDYDGENVTLDVQEDVTGYHISHPAEAVELQVKPEAYTEKSKDIPDIGVAGYVLPQTQQENLLWPGWDSMAVAEHAPKAKIIIEIVALTGPGDVYLWQNTIFDEPKSLLGGDLRLRQGAKITQDGPAHVHANWLFTKAGNYKMTAQATVIDGDRRTVSDKSTLSWIVGEPNKPKDDDTEADNEQQSPDDKTQTTPPSNNKPGKKNAPGSASPLKPAAEQCIPTEVTVPASGKASGSHTIAANTHVHPNWVFSAPGTYRVTLTHTATSKSGKKMSATDTLTFQVGGRGGNANSGHFDVGTAVVNGKLTMLVKDDRSQPATWRKPGQLVFGLSDAAKATAPAGIDFVAPAGAPVWIISSTQVRNVPWVGANTQHQSLRQHTTGAVTWTVNRVQGPGAMAVFESGQFGQVVGNRWFNASANGTAKVIVGKTPSGADCELSAAQIAQIEANGGVVGGRLATTGGQETLYWLGAALSLLLAGLLTHAVSRTSPIKAS